MSEKDIDPQETTEWLEAFRSVARFEGEDRAKYILQKLMDMAMKMEWIFQKVSTQPTLTQFL